MHPKFKEAINFHKKGELKKANDLCLEILKQEPDNFDILHLAGVIAFQNKKYQISTNFLKKASKINSSNPEVYNNLGIALKKLNKPHDAIQSWNQSIKIKPDFVQAYNNRGIILAELNQLDAALENYNKIIEINPNFSEAYNNKGNILNKLNRLDEAINSYSKAILINPNFAEAYYNRGTIQKDLKLYESAYESYNQAVKIKPNLDFLLGSLIFTKLNLCDWESLDKDLKTLEKNILKNNKSLTPFSSLLFYNSSLLQKRVADTYLKAKYDSKNFTKYSNKIKKNKKIRIGYYSADFRKHVMSDLLINLFKEHDESKFEIIGFSFSPGKPDKMHNEIKKNLINFLM